MLKSYEAALGDIEGICHEAPLVCVSIKDAIGKTLGSDLKARVASPPFTNSAMDGYAIKGAAKPGVVYSVLGSVYAGEAPVAQPLQPPTAGCAIKIMTGAKLPDDFDTVVPVELTKEVAGGISIIEPLSQGANVRHKGSDLEAGEVILRKNQVMTPERGLLARATGHSEVAVYGKPKIALFYTGDELSSDDAPLEGSMIYNSSKVFLEGALKKLGISPFSQHHLTDEPQAAKEKVEVFLRQQGPKVIITTGAVSMGDRDFIPLLAGQLGFTTLFHRIAIRPGKPVFLAQKEGVYWLGLPGNPISSLVTWYYVALPLLAKVALTGELSRFSVTLSEGVAKPKHLRCFYRGIVEGGFGRPVGCQKSAHIKSLSEANALLELPEGRDYIEKGSTISAIRMH